MFMLLGVNNVITHLMPRSVAFEITDLYLLRLLACIWTWKCIVILKEFIMILATGVAYSLPHKKRSRGEETCKHAMLHKQLH